MSTSKGGRDLGRGALAVIPARGGSKRIPLKNIRPLGGRPLIAYTIEAARDSGIFSRIVVSTDSDEIAEIAAEAGAEIPYLREAKLADDHTPVSLVTLDALTRLDPEGTDYEAVAQLMPNCPLRDAEDVRSSYREFAGGGADAQVSVCNYGWLNPWWAMTRASSHVVRPLFEQETLMRSQDLPELFCPTGAIWWARSSVLRSRRTFHVDGRTGWELPWDHGVDIDDEADWRLAEAVILMRQVT